MSQISIESIQAAINKIDGLSEDELDNLIEGFTLKQEPLVGYILQAGLEYENEDLNVFAIYYFAIIHESFDQQGITLKEISEDDIDNFQEPFVLALDAIHKSEDSEPMQDLIQEPHLVGFVMNEIDAEDEDGETLSENTKSQLFIVTSGIIGLMHGASE